jgi:hypothetical protein
MQIMAASSPSPGQPIVDSSRRHRNAISARRPASFQGEAQPARPPIPQPDNPKRDHTMPFTLLSDDELIALLLIHTWTLTTGKTLRGDIPPHELTEEELIDFWSDDDRFD